MESSQLIGLARDLGVAGVVLLVLVLRIEPKLDKLAGQLERLTDAVQVHSLTARADRIRHSVREERE